MRQTDLVLLYRSGSSSSDRGVEYPVVLRNTGSGTFWDVVLRATHDGEETDRKTVARLGPEFETDRIFLLIPARFCDTGTPGIGKRPLGNAVAEALVEGEVVATAELPSRGVDEPKIDRVPRTPEEEAQLIAARPDAWEFLLFASVLRRQMDALEPKYRDHELRFALPGQGPVLEGLEATQLLKNAFAESRALIGNVDRVFDQSAQERAFGALGEPGDPDRIEHMASRVIAIYDGLLDWAARLRGTPVEDEFSRAVEVASRMVDLAIQQFREFVASVKSQMDALPSLLAAETEEPVSFTLTLRLDINERTQEEFSEEMTRLEETYVPPDDWFE